MLRPRDGVFLAIVAGLSLAGCASSDIMAELGSAGRAVNEAAAAPIQAAQSAVYAAGEALKGPDTSPENQQAFGDRLALQALSKATRSHDRELEGYLTTLANHIARHAPGERFDYRVYLVEEPAPNAFTPGGGHIFVTTGLVARLADEAQMAMVLAHEIAHNTQAHVVKGAHRRRIGERAARVGTGIPWIGDKVGVAINATVNLYSRDHEDQADEHGLDYLVAAGYDPGAAPATFAALVDEEDGGWWAIIDPSRRHGAKSRRIIRIENLIKAKYGEASFAAARRSTPAYERLTRRHRTPPASAG